MKNYLLNETKIGNAKVIVDLLPTGKVNPNRKLNSIGYITIHNTGVIAPAKNNHNYMKTCNKNGERKASWHFTVDENNIYQAMPTNLETWHAGNTTGNRNSISIEICQSNNKGIQEQIYKNAIELVKILMAYHNIPISKVVQHNKWSGKDCPQYLRSSKHGYGWKWFIDNCNHKNVSGGAFKNGSYEGRKAKVTATSLNIRFDRGTDQDVIAKAPKGHVFNLGYCLNGWVAVKGYKGNKGFGYVSTEYLELI